MTTLSNKLIATPGICACHSVHTTLVHHRDFPELWAEGGTAVEAARSLAQMLSNSLADCASSWRRVAVNDAISDVAEYIAELTGTHPIELLSVHDYAC
jgi:hypothetical protein